MRNNSRSPEKLTNAIKVLIPKSFKTSTHPSRGPRNSPLYRHLRSSTSVFFDLSLSPPSPPSRSACRDSHGLIPRLPSPSHFEVCNPALVGNAISQICFVLMARRAAESCENRRHVIELYRYLNPTVWIISIFG